MTPAASAIRTEFACDHPRVEVVFKEGLAAGSRVYLRQCQCCGEDLGKAKPSSLEAAHAPPYDAGLRPRWWQARSERLAEVEREAKEEKSGEWWAAYNEYLRTPQWQAKRAKVMERSGGICEGCLERPAVQVHHLTYIRVGREMLFDLVAICIECHEEVHGNRQVQAI
jgi:5-methylcytosine-specific restriction endonuclease McrA